MLDTGKSLREFLGDIDQVRIEAADDAAATKQRIGGKLEQLARERALREDHERLGAKVAEDDERDDGEC